MIFVLLLKKLPVRISTGSGISGTLEAVIPKLDISYDYAADGKSASVIIKQTQSGKIFRLPVAIDVYQGAAKKRYKVVMENQADTFTFNTVSKPDLINVDGDKMLLCEKSDHKTLDNYIFQYANAGLYLDRREAIEFASGKQVTDPAARNFMKTALNDKYYGLRLVTLAEIKPDE